MSVNDVKLLLKVTGKIWSRHNECSAEDITQGFKKGWMKVVKNGKEITDLRKVKAIANTIGQKCVIK